MIKIKSDKIQKIIKISPQENKEWDSKKIHHFLENKCFTAFKLDLEQKERETQELYNFIREIAIQGEFMRNQQYRSRWNNILEQFDKKLLKQAGFDLEFLLVQFIVPDEIKNNPAYKDIKPAYTHRSEGMFYFEALDYLPPISDDLKSSAKNIKEAENLDI